MVRELFQKCKQHLSTSGLCGSLLLFIYGPRDSPIDLMRYINLYYYYYLSNSGKGAWRTAVAQ